MSRLRSGARFLARFRNPTVRDWLIGLTLLAAILRFHNLETKSVWRDEAATAFMVSGSVGQMFLRNAAIELYPPGGYLLFYPGILVAGRSEFGLRLSVAWAGVLAVPLMYQVGRRLVDRRVGLWAALLLTVNPFHLWYSQEARQHAFAMFCTLLMVYTFVWVVKRGSIGQWIAYIVAHAVGYWIHILAASLYAMAEYFFLGFYVRTQRRLFRRWIAAQAVATSLLLPWLALFAAHSEGSDRLQTLNPWIPRPTLWTPFETLSVFSFFSATPLLHRVGLAVGVAVAAWGLRANRKTAFHRARIWLAIWLVAPPVLLWVVSQARPLYVHRYLSSASLAWLLLLAVGLTRIRMTPVRLAIGLLLAGLMLTSSLRIHSDPDFAPKEDWREVAALMAAHELPGDVLVLPDWLMGVSYDYYDHDSIPRVETPYYWGGPLALKEIVVGSPRIWLIIMPGGLELMVIDPQTWPACTWWRVTGVVLTVCDV